MAGLQNRRVVLARRPVGEPQDEDFRIETIDVPELADGEVLVAVEWLSIDPYMRGRMNDTKSYAKSVELGEVMVGGTVGQVIRSRAAAFQPGDWICAQGGFQTHAVLAANAPRVYQVDVQALPASAYLGVAGMPGQTAYFGLTRVGKPKPRETVVVSAAAGAVGSVVGQLAGLLGARAVGIAGGPEKCAWVRDTCGFACVDYKAGDLAAALREACPDGIDVYFENVGGPVLEAVAPLLNRGARVPICGMISQYNATAPVQTPFDVLGAHPLRPEHRFFGVMEWIAEFPEATAQLMAWVRSGKLHYREHIMEGLASAPEALRAVLSGKNHGKMLIKVGQGA